MGLLEEWMETISGDFDDQLGRCFTHDVDVCGNGEESGGTTDGPTGGTDGDDIRGVHLDTSFNNAVGVYDDGE